MHQQPDTGTPKDRDTAQLLAGTATTDKSGAQIERTVVYRAAICPTHNRRPRGCNKSVGGYYGKRLARRILNGRLVHILRAPFAL